MKEWPSVSVSVFLGQGVCVCVQDLTTLTNCNTRNILADVQNRMDTNILQERVGNYLNRWVNSKHPLQSILIMPFRLLGGGQ